jgi:hypothetical protein
MNRYGTRSLCFISACILGLLSSNPCLLHAIPATPDAAQQTSGTGSQVVVKSGGVRPAVQKPVKPATTSKTSKAARKSKKPAKTSGH